MTLPRVSNKALGRDLGDLLSRARPSRLVDKVAPGQRPAPAPAPAPGAVEPPAPEGVVPTATTPDAPVLPLPSLSLSESDAVPSATPVPEPASTPTPGPDSHRPGSPASQPASGPGPRVAAGWGLICFALDVALLAGAVYLVRGGIQSLSLPASLGLAVLGVFLGAGFALAGVACFRRSPVRSPRIGEGGTKIRVQLKR